MKKSTRVWLLVAICFTVYMIYLAAAASFYEHDRFPAVRAIPFGLLSQYEYQRLLNWILGFAAVSWITWGVKFIREGVSSTRESAPVVTEQEDAG